MDARRIMMLRRCWLLLALLGAQACGGGEELPQSKVSSPIRQADSAAPAALAGGDRDATPMREREAVIGLLNKRNGITRDLKMKPGQALRAGDAIVRLRACETTAPWEQAKETGAFVQLDVRMPKEDKWRRVFSGWLFRERPDRNVVEHPVYDVWVKSCAMKWPDTGPDTLKAADKSGANAAADSAPGPADNSAASSPSATSPSAASSTE
jgi:hypothetical protein